MHMELYQPLIHRLLESVGFKLICKLSLFWGDTLQGPVIINSDAIL